MLPLSLFYLIVNYNKLYKYNSNLISTSRNINKTLSNKKFVLPAQLRTACARAMAKKSIRTSAYAFFDYLLKKVLKNDIINLIM